MKTWLMNIYVRLDVMREKKSKNEAYQMYLSTHRLVSLFIDTISWLFASLLLICLDRLNDRQRKKKKKKNLKCNTCLVYYYHHHHHHFLEILLRWWLLSRECACYRVSSASFSSKENINGFCQLFSLPDDSDMFACVDRQNTYWYEWS